MRSPISSHDIEASTCANSKLFEEDDAVGRSTFVFPLQIGTCEAVSNDILDVDEIDALIGEFSWFYVEEAKENFSRRIEALRFDDIYISGNRCIQRIVVPGYATRLQRELVFYERRDETIGLRSVDIAAMCNEVYLEELFWRWRPPIGEQPSCGAHIVRHRVRYFVDIRKIERNSHQHGFIAGTRSKCVARDFRCIGDESNWIYAANKRSQSRSRYAQS